MRYLPRAVPHARVALLAVSLLAAIAIQQWLSGHPDALGPSFLGICGCGLIIAVLLGRLPQDQSPPSMPAPSAESPVLPSPAGVWLPALGAILGMACGLVGATQVKEHVFTAQLWWAAAIAAPVLALLVQRWRVRVRRQARASLDRQEWTTMGALLLLALAVRVPLIADIPPFVHGDESACGLFGRQFNSGAPLLSISWFELPMLSYAVSGLGLRLFGDTLTGLRMTNAVIGSASVVGLYLLGKELFGRRAALLSSLILAITFLHVTLSRDGIHYMQGPACITLTLYLCVRWLRRGGALTALLIGMSVVLDLQVYWSARVAIVLAAALLLFVLVRERQLLVGRWTELVWVFVGLVASGLPLAGLFLAVPGSFNGHQNEVNILNGTPDTLGHLSSIYGTRDMPTIVLQQAWRILTTFNAWGDASFQIGWAHGMLDTVSAALLPAALFLALWRCGRWPYALVLGWFGAVIAAGILTIDPPWWPRLAALLPAVALLLGHLLAEFSRLLNGYLAPRWRAVTVATLVVVLGCMAVGNFRLVFVDYPNAAAQSMTMWPTWVGRFLNQNPNGAQTVLLSDGSFYVDYDVVQFLAPHSGGCTLMSGQPLSQCALSMTSRLFVLLPGRIADLAWLEKQRPGGKVIDIIPAGQVSYRILAYELPRP